MEGKNGKVFWRWLPDPVDVVREEGEAILREASEEEGRDVSLGHQLLGEVGDIGVELWGGGREGGRECKRGGTDDMLPWSPRGKYT